MANGRLIVDINAMCRYIPPNLSTSKVGDKHDFFSKQIWHNSFSQVLDTEVSLAIDLLNLRCFVLLQKLSNMELLKFGLFGAKVDQFVIEIFLVE